MSKLIQLKLSDKKLGKYNQLVELIGYKGSFGEHQKAIDFSIDFCLAMLPMFEKSIPRLNPDKLELFFQSIKKLRKAKEKAESIKKIHES